MEENKKIKNATKHEYEGIPFKSALEVMVYKTLIQEGFTPQYEQQTFTIWEGFAPTIPFYTRNRLKRRDRRYEIISNNVLRDNRPLNDITYTPDFYFEFGDKKIFVEVKGFQNDVFPYKFKMFKKYLESLDDKECYQIWEVFTKKQLIECINLLRQSPSQ